MKEHSFFLEENEYIELCDLLKKLGLCENGGEAKNVIAGGAVLVDDNVETRKRCKIKRGQFVKYKGQVIKVV
ncbi:MAG: RNA-binding S4 domain-containing protein [Oligoflexia bacterium]|nr:RNA-binding S4 domain-containing protein [Oligoflexia bacterium]